MKTDELQDVLAWIRGTDLVEVRFKKGAKGFTFATAPAAASLPAYFPGPRLTPVISQWVGLFRAAPAGKAAALKEGGAVAQGEVLGLVDAGLGKTPSPVASPLSGRLSRVLIEDGQAVQFGQPLFFIEP